MNDEAARFAQVGTVCSEADVIRAFNERWALSDFDGSLELVAEDATYTLHISEDLHPVGGVTKGRTAIGEALRQLRRDYQYLMYHPYNLVSEGNFVRQQVHFLYRHRASGEMLRGTFRIHFQVVCGLITSAEEYHDRALVEAFLRLYGV